MADSRFFQKVGPFTGVELADLCRGSFVGQEALLFDDVAPLDLAQKNHVCFLDNSKYLRSFETSNAGLSIIHPDYQDKAPEEMALILHPNPYLAYALIARHFYPESSPVDTTRINRLAHCAETATIGERCRIDAGVTIGENCVIGAGTWIKANAVIEDGVEIGQACQIGANTTIAYSLIGDHVTVHAGCQIGQDGFGFASDPAIGHVRIPQLGRVVIEKHVNIGANTTIDRGAGPDTVIGAGSQIDNLVQIGHNVKLGRGCVIVSKVGISGSTELGDFVVCGGQTGIAGHLKIGSGVRIAARSGVTKNIPAGKTMAGFPAQDHKQWLRDQAKLSRFLKTK